MAQSTDVTLTAATWTQITNADATGNITFQNKTGDRLWVKATVNTTQPTNFDGSIAYEPLQGESLKTLAQIFTGLTSPVRLWGWSHNGGKVAFQQA